MLTLSIQPGARATRVVGPYANALKVQVQAAPIEGQANAALIKFLAKAFQVPVRQVRLLQGALGRRKVVAIFATRIEPEILWPPHRRIEA